MQEIEDERWRLAARSLELELVDDEGKVVPNEQGTQAHAMRGRVEDRRVSIRYGATDPRDRITVVEVMLRRPLLLGMATQVYRDPAPKDNRYGIVRPGVFSASKAVDQARVKVFFEETQRGRELWGALHELASLGWAELTDSHLRVQAEVYVNSADGWLELIRRAVATAALAETARNELPPLPWETQLLDRLDAEREALGLSLDRQIVRLSGTIRATKVSVRLAVKEGRYALFHGVTLAPPLPKGEKLSRRVKPTSFLTKLWPGWKEQGKGSWEDCLEATGVIRERLSLAQLEGLATLSRTGDVAVDPSTLTFWRSDLDAGVAEVLDQLVGVASALARASMQPYRS